jgi:N-acetylglutamate synthase-like GNAT family acetyltransferase
MIILKNSTDINDDIREKLNEFILKSFNETRLYTYDKVVYYSNNDSNKTIIGFIGINDFDETILISQLCTDVNYRNKGIATQLLKFIETTFNSNLILYIKNDSNYKKLYDFYTKRGFIEVYNDSIKYKMKKNKSHINY